MYHEAANKNWEAFFQFYPLRKLFFLEGVPNFQFVKIVV